LGEHFRGKLRQLAKASDGWITEVRGMGLLNAIVINETKSTKGRGAWHLCLIMAEKGILAKPTHVNTIRLAPPLVITEQELDKAVEVIKASLAELDTVRGLREASSSDTNNTMRRGRPFTIYRRWRMTSTPSLSVCSIGGPARACIGASALHSPLSG
jgi:hypothetical protein